MSITDHVVVTARLNNAGVARLGFGTAMILSHKVTFLDRIRYYSSVAEAVDDGLAEDSPEIRAATALMSQSPRPQQFAIGRADGDVTMTYVITVASVVASTSYKVAVSGEGFDDETVTGASDVGPTNDEIVDALVTALNGVDDKNFTAAATGSVGSKVCTVTGNAANDWFSLEILDPNLLKIAQTGGDANVDDDLDAILLADPIGWYALITLYNSADYVDTASTWIEGQTKVYYTDSGDTNTILTTYVANTNDDALAVLMDAGVKRSIGWYHPSPADFLAASIAGRLLPLNPGQWTAKFKSLSGPTPVTLTTTQRTNIIGRRANSYTSEGGRRITWEGTVPDETFGFFDVVVGLDWLVDDIQKGVFGVLVSNDKVAYTDEDIANIEAAVRGSASRAQSDDHPVLARDPAPQVSFPKVADIDPSTRALRILPDGLLTGQLAGAVHKVLVDIFLTA